MVGSSVTVALLAICPAFVGSVLADGVSPHRAPDEKLVKTLTTNQVTQFQGYVQAKDLRNQEFAVCGRILNEKRSEAQMIRKLMLSRRLTEQQITVLMQLRAEKMKESGKTDAKLREVFGLDPKAQYRLEAATGRLLLVGKKSDQDVEPATDAGAASVKAALAKAKK
ncbi:MAG TPA: hypothetical protein P5026_06365 [Kiritimatiellia bacterium]|nr:hypothetical protein [Kiritimatiellia bacterium]HRU70480.1 hypothetical protein [Kiritimatiellia bacterium]